MERHLYVVAAGYLMTFASLLALTLVL